MQMIVSTHGGQAKNKISLHMPLFSHLLVHTILIPCLSLIWIINFMIVNSDSVHYYSTP